MGGSLGSKKPSHQSQNQSYQTISQINDRSMMVRHEEIMNTVLGFTPTEDFMD
jgi:hypothetical protein